MTFKELCVVLRRQDHTITEIMKITGRPKTSIHYHIQDIPLSSHKRQLITESYRRTAFKLSEKSRFENEKEYKKFSDWDSRSVLLVAHFLFDGEINYGRCRYNNRCTVLIERVQTLAQQFWVTPPKIRQNQMTGVMTISYNNASLSRYIKEKSEELLTSVTLMNNDLKREFLRAFFDDEGCMNFRKNDRKVRGYQKNVAILEIVQNLLLDFGITSKILRPNEIKIVGQGNLVKFQKEIGFSPGVRINGKRSNSIWKKSLEKREILRRAIASYKPIGSNGVHRTATV